MLLRTFLMMFFGKILKKKEIVSFQNLIGRYADTPGEINLIEWTKYRQRLRDLTESYSSPKEVVFPFKPDQVEEHEPRRSY